MSKRSKFVFCTWVGPNVSVMKKAKMSTDKALMKELVKVGKYYFFKRNSSAYNVKYLELVRGASDRER